MNNKLVINFIPGKTTLHKMAGSTKVLLFVLFTIAIIAAFDSARRGDKPTPIAREYASEGFVDGYWFGKPGIAAVMNDV